MRNPICQFCNQPIKPTWGFDCPNCEVSYHKKCIRSLSNCLTCAAELLPKERPPLKVGESLRIPDRYFLDLLHPYVRSLGLTLTGAPPFLFLFWNDRAVYLLAFFLGLFCMGLSKWLPRILGSAHVVQPARRAIMREIVLFDRSLQWTLCTFEDVRSIRIEGEQRYFGGPKHQLDYHYDVFWISLVTRSGRHIPISGEVRTDQDEGYKVGNDYDYGGLRPTAEKVAWATGTDFWVSPDVAPCNALAGLGPTALCLALTGLLLLLGMTGPS